MKVNIIDPTIDNRWDQFVRSQEHRTVFHTSAWAHVLKETYGYLPRYYVLENEAGQLEAAIPFCRIRSILTGKRLICLPFSDLCWPFTQEKADISLLLNSAKNEIETGAASYLEIRGWQNRLSQTGLGLINHDYYVSYILNLPPSIEILREKFHDSIRRGIRQAEKRGIVVRITSSEDAVEHFYRLHVVTRKKLGVLPQPHSFFKNLFRHMISQNLGFTAMAECEGKVIAGVVFLTHKDTMYYKFNASDENYLQRRPNHLVIWEAIRYAYTNNYRRIDFGRCTPEEEGLRVFKSRWGAKEMALPYYYYPEVKGFTAVHESSSRYRAMRLFSHIIPDFAFRAVGSLLYKHLA